MRRLKPKVTSYDRRESTEYGICINARINFEPLEKRWKWQKTPAIAKNTLSGIKGAYAYILLYYSVQYITYNLFLYAA